MTQLDRWGQGDPLSAPFTAGMRDNPDELTVIPDEITRDFVTSEYPTPTEEFAGEWRNASYNCFSSGHKFCREVCPVMQVTRNESWTPTAFHANVVAMDKGELTFEDVAADHVNCTQCGACELRCPNTLFTGDFYRFRTRTVDVVKAVRAFASKSGVHQQAWQTWSARTDAATRGHGWRGLDVGGHALADSSPSRTAAPSRTTGVMLSLCRNRLSGSTVALIRRSRARVLGG